MIIRPVPVQVAVFRVFYRAGGELNWNFHSSFSTLEEALSMKAELEENGFEVLVS